MALPTWRTLPDGKAVTNYQPSSLFGEGELHRLSCEWEPETHNSRSYEAEKEVPSRQSCWKRERGERAWLFEWERTQALYCFSEFPVEWSELPKMVTFLRNMPFIGLLPSFSSFLHASGVFWDHPPHKPLTLQSRPQSLPPGEPKLKQIR